MASIRRVASSGIIAIIWFRERSRVNPGRRLRGRAPSSDLGRIGVLIIFDAVFDAPPL